MEVIKTNKEFENKLFNRKEIELEVKANVTPSKNEVDKFLSEKYSSSPDKIRIVKIVSNFGSNIFKISANIYKTREDMFSTERFSKKEKEKIKKIEEEKNKPLEEPKTEEKQEEKVEDKKEEVKENN